MITDEEKIEIINLAVEKALLMIPEVVGNMMANHAMLNKLNSKFYKDHPEFADSKDIVASVLEVVEGKNPLISYDDLLDKAIPEIKKRIQVTKTLNTDSIKLNPSRDFKQMSIHGEL